MAWFPDIQINKLTGICLLTVHTAFRYLHKLYTELSRRKGRLRVRHLPLEDIGALESLPSHIEEEIYNSRLQLVLVSPVLLQFIQRHPKLIIGGKFFHCIIIQASEISLFRTNIREGEGKSIHFCSSQQPWLFELFCCSENWSPRTPVLPSNNQYREIKGQISN